MMAILPHGVLFRGAAEGKIRQNLIPYMDTVIGIAGKMFLYTDIPVCMIGIRKEVVPGLYVIDAQNQFAKQGKRNVMDKDQIRTVTDALNKRISIDKLARFIADDEIEANDYNLNIPRYVDTSDPEPQVDLAANFRKLREVRAQIRKADDELMEMMVQLAGWSQDEIDALQIK